MGVGVRSVTYFGWPISKEDIVRIAGEIDHDEPWEEAADKLGCRIQQAGSCYSGEMRYYVDLRHRDDPQTLAGLVRADARKDDVRAMAASYGLVLPGEPEQGADVLLWEPEQGADELWY